METPRPAPAGRTGRRVRGFVLRWLLLTLPGRGGRLAEAWPFSWPQSRTALSRASEWADGRCKSAGAWRGAGHNFRPRRPTGPISPSPITPAAGVQTTTNDMAVTAPARPAMFQDLRPPPGRSAPPSGWRKAKGLHAEHPGGDTVKASESLTESLSGG